MARTFVFEGADLVGKSTTAKVLAEQNSFRLERNVAVRDTYQLLSSVIDDIERARLRQMCVGTTTLFDRWQLISDIIYCSYIYSTESRLMPFMEEFFEQCNKAGIVFCIFHCSDEAELEKRYAERGDAERNLAEIKVIQRAYLDFFSVGLGKHLQHVLIDTANKSPEDVIIETKQCIKILGGC